MSAYTRMYIDLPTETKARLVQRAAALGMAQKRLVALLIERECDDAEGDKPNTTRKKRGKK